MTPVYGLNGLIPETGIKVSIKLSNGDILVGESGQVSRMRSDQIYCIETVFFPTIAPNTFIPFYGSDIEAWEPCITALDTTP